MNKETELIEATRIAQVIASAIEEASHVCRYEEPVYNVESIYCGPGGYYDSYEAVEYLEGRVHEDDTSDYEYDYAAELQKDDTYKIESLIVLDWPDNIPASDSLIQLVEQHLNAR